jgi:hypothetical protein
MPPLFLSGRRRLCLDPRGRYAAASDQHDPEHALIVDEVTRKGRTLNALFRMKEVGLATAVGLPNLRVWHEPSTRWQLRSRCRSWINWATCPMRPSIPKPFGFIAREDTQKAGLCRPFVMRYAPDQAALAGCLPMMIIPRMSSSVTSFTFTVPTSWPFFMTLARSQSFITLWMSCSIRKMPRPCALSS